MRRRDFVAGALGALACLAGCGTEPGRPVPRFAVVPAGASWEPIAETLSGLLDPADLARGGTRLTVTGLPALAAAEMARTSARGTPIARLVGDVEVLVVARKSRFPDFDAFAAHLVASPGETVLAGRKQGESDHLLFGLVARGLGADARVLDYAGYPTCEDAAEALLTGRVGVAAGPLGQWRERIAGGRVRVLAVSSAERVEGIDAPTLLESGARVDFADWSAVLGPDEMGDGERARAVDLLDEVARSERWLRACRDKGWTPLPLLGDDFRVWLGSETARTRAVLGELGLLDTTCGRSCARGH
ncbi:hypothetical protein GCM10010404_86470 [Nonomuraea africana]|uniref:Tricarboxylic transport membrane protein n=1 Tax=Nonomuraea africana TaxID=46171 RepID=A0ABR9K9W4_9ACTN|nr:tripartite tricarboxylate transporter substrate-binding protein [Nonomuraea africana]MBE1558801.1 putative tricarboxylic transport membrane protein [Nonomuraea africana]